MTKLNPDQVEVSIFGPGYGECILIHIGSGQWIVIDSCAKASRTPIALGYLRELGFTSEDVRLIVATHWHDDHVRGLAELLRTCTKATFAASLAMSGKEFAKMALARRNIHATSTTTGVDEITGVYSLLREGKRTAIKAKAHSPIFAESGANLAHGYDCKIMALSPSDRQIDIFLDDIAEMMPQITNSESRCVSRSPNHFAVVCCVQIGPLTLLLGADLEETADSDTGWSTIVASQIRPNAKASIFKIPHHGSQNGHYEQVWTDMLIPKPFAILTPWSRGAGLPQDQDIVRINGYTPNAYATARLARARTPIRRASAVERTLRESGISITNAEPAMGHVRLRNGGANDFNQWHVTLDQRACRLVDWNVAA